mgnify:CR=1 FL=1
MPAPIVRTDYLFRFHSPSILSTGYRATLMAILDFDTAISLQSDLVAIHAAVLPDLPVGTPINARELTYYRIRTSSGESRVIASVWVLGDPTVISDQTAVFTINSIDATTISLIRDLLVANGITNFTVS